MLGVKNENKLSKLFSMTKHNEQIFRKQEIHEGTCLFCTSRVKTKTMRFKNNTAHCPYCEKDKIVPHINNEVLDRNIVHDLVRKFNDKI